MSLGFDLSGWLGSVRRREKPPTGLLADLRVLLANPLTVFCPGCEKDVPASEIVRIPGKDDEDDDLCRACFDAAEDIVETLQHG